MKKILSLTLALVMLASVFAFSATAVTYEEKTVAVNWNYGYVGSSTNASWANKINPTGSGYSYSDVIDMGPAGSTISFADSASGYASASAYIFSFWTKNGEEYVIDTEAANIPGNFGGVQREYTFVTTEDNQAIRVCYESKQTASFTPAEFEKVYVDGVEVAVNWNFGYVGSSSNASWADKINPSGSNYSHSDVFVVAKAGSKVTFTDSNKNGSAFCSNSAYVFSTWTKEGDDWKFVSGVKGIEGATYVESVLPYTYTSTKDNELVRLCYNSGEKADAPIAAADRPVVTLTSPVADTPVVPDTPVTPDTPSVDTGDSTLVLAASIISVVTLAAVVMKKRASR